MGLNPARRYDYARREKRRNEEIRQLRTRPRGHAEAKTFLVSGDITAGLYVPPVFFANDPDNTIPEIKLLYELRGVLRAGTCDVSWTHNGSSLAGADQTITTNPTDSIVTLTAPGERIAHGDYFQVTIVSATGASDLSLALFVVTRQA